MKRVALTFIGKDRPGIIAGVSEALYKAGCNIEDTTMTLLEGEFAMILIALLPNVRRETSLKRAFDALQRRWGLTHFWRPLPGRVVRGEKHPRGSVTYLVTVIGKDRTGIVSKTSRILAQNRLNITDLNSKILGRGSRTLFTMMLEVDLPKRFRIAKLKRALKRLETELKVDVKLRPIERFPL